MGERVIVLDAGEGSWQCYSVVEYLAERGVKMEILSKFLFVGIELNPSSIIGLYQRLLRKGVVFTPISSIKEIREGSIISYNLFSGKERRIEGTDTLVVSMGNRARSGLYRELKEKVPTLFTIGDCVAPRRITDAIREGNRVARSL